MNRSERILAAVRPSVDQLAESVGRLLYPPHCVVCSRATDVTEDRYLCRHCIGEIRFVIGDTCPRCGHELGPHVSPETRCVHCRHTPLRFHRAVAAAHHAGAARDMVLALKFGRRTHNAYPLGKILANRLFETDIPGKVQHILPVPLHRSRLRSRGFNQSRLLADELGQRLGLPVLVGRLRRRVNTPPQTGATSVAARRANVKDAFRLRNAEALKGKSVLLVDDVLTTGATTSECAGVLRRAGVRRVYVATVTRRMTTPAEDEPTPDRYPVRAAAPEPPPDA
jgi:ComF family protein